jgi:uncharacterized membrane protein
MTNYLVAISTWFHVLATIVWIGYYVFTSLIYLPVFERQMQANAESCVSAEGKNAIIRELLEQVSARLRPFFGGSLLIFLVTGTHLMLINEHYLGLGNFFGNPWSVLIVIKHVLVLAFLALAVFSERAFLGQISEQNSAALKKFRRAMNINAFLGVVILLLTSIAQAV